VISNLSEWDGRLTLTVSSSDETGELGSTPCSGGKLGAWSRPVKAGGVFRAMMADEIANDAVADPAGELTRLREEHRDLDEAIEALKVSVAVDQLQLQRLKKRKLVLRDRITHLEDQITPDIIA
jgi:hypothetical protein